MRPHEWDTCWGQSIRQGKDHRQCHPLQKAISKGLFSEMGFNFKTTYFRKSPEQPPQPSSLLPYLYLPRSTPTNHRTTCFSLLKSQTIGQKKKNQSGFWTSRCSSCQPGQGTSVQRRSSGQARGAQEDDHRSYANMTADWSTWRARAHVAPRVPGTPTPSCSWTCIDT